MTDRGRDASATLRLSLPPEVAEALEQRARRNDRLAFEEARSIIRRSLARELAERREPKR